MTGNREESKENDNEFCWREPCSTATGTGAGRLDWQTTKTHSVELDARIRPR